MLELEGDEVDELLTPEVDWFKLVWLPEPQGTGPARPRIAH